MAHKIFQVPLTDKDGIVSIFSMVERCELPTIVWTNLENGEKLVGWAKFIDVSFDKILFEAINFKVQVGETLFIYQPGSEIASRITVKAIPLPGQFISDVPEELKFFVAFEGSVTHVRSIDKSLTPKIITLLEKILVKPLSEVSASLVLKELMTIKEINIKLGEIIKLLSGKLDLPNKVEGEKLKSGVELENESQFIHLRSAPRSKPKAEQIITLKCKKESGTEIVDDYLLYDLSQGGMAFRVYHYDEFSVGEKISVVAMGGKQMSQPLVGIIRSIRALPKEISEFKVGVQFIKAY